MNDVPIDQLLGPYGLLVALILATYVMARVLFRQMRKVEEERDFWRDKSVRLLETASQAVNSAVRLAPEQDIAAMAKVVDEARRNGELP